MPGQWAGSAPHVPRPLVPLNHMPRNCPTQLEALLSSNAGSVHPTYRCRAVPRSFASVDRSLPRGEHSAYRVRRITGMLTKELNQFGSSGKA